MTNPFIQKAQQRKSRAQATMTNHVKELEKLHDRFSDNDPTKARIAERLKEVREQAARA